MVFNQKTVIDSLLSFFLNLVYISQKTLIVSFLHVRTHPRLWYLQATCKRICQSDHLISSHHVIKKNIGFLNTRYPKTHLFCLKKFTKIGIPITPCVPELYRVPGTFPQNKIRFESLPWIFPKLELKYFEICAIVRFFLF
jgi:hypothetical protein